MKHHYIDRYSNLDSPLHRLDPRVKILLVFFGILIMVSEPPGRLPPFAFYGGMLLVLLVASRLPPVFLLKRFLILSPFILMASVFYPVSLYLTKETQAIAFQREALEVALSIFLKAALSLLLLIWMISVERFHVLLMGLRKLKMPKLVGTISILMYSYLFVFWDEALKTTRARESRTPGKLTRAKLKTYSNQMAMILLHSWERSKTLHHAMLARGFHGEFYSLQQQGLKKRDVVFLVVFLLIFLNVRLFSGSLLNVAIPLLVFIIPSFIIALPLHHFTNSLLNL